MVLEHEGPGIVPVIRDVASVVDAHHVVAGPSRRAVAGGAVRVVGVAAAVGSSLGLPDEPVHLASGAGREVRAVRVGGGVALAVRPAGVSVGVVEEGADRRVVVARVRHARRSGQIDSGRARISPEVAIERTVLLHDYHHVPDLVDLGDRDRQHR